MFTTMFFCSKDSRKRSCSQDALDVSASRVWLDGQQCGRVSLPCRNWCPTLIGKESLICSSSKTFTWPVHTQHTSILVTCISWAQYFCNNRFYKDGAAAMGWWSSSKLHFHEIDFCNSSYPGNSLKLNCLQYDDVHWWVTEITPVIPMPRHILVIYAEVLCAKCTYLLMDQPQIPTIHRGCILYVLHTVLYNEVRQRSASEAKFTRLGLFSEMAH